MTNVAASQDRTSVWNVNEPTHGFSESWYSNSGSSSVPHLLNILTYTKLAPLPVFPRFMKIVFMKCKYWYLFNISAYMRKIKYSTSEQGRQLTSTSSCFLLGGPSAWFSSHNYISKHLCLTLGIHSFLTTTTTHTQRSRIPNMPPEMRAM